MTAPWSAAALVLRDMLLAAGNALPADHEVYALERARTLAQSSAARALLTEAEADLEKLLASVRWREQRAIARGLYQNLDLPKGEVTDITAARAILHYEEARRSVHPDYRHRVTAYVLADDLTGERADRCSVRKIAYTIRIPTIGVAGGYYLLARLFGPVAVMTLPSSRWKLPDGWVMIEGKRTAYYRADPRTVRVPTTPRPVRVPASIQRSEEKKERKDCSDTPLFRNRLTRK